MHIGAWLIGRLNMMLTATSPWRRHFAQNALLIRRKQIRSSPTFRPHVILVTGVGMSKGLALARQFHRAGQDVIGADFESSGVPVCGRFSKALKQFYTLPRPNDQDGSAHYIRTLLDIIRREDVSLWVSCSGVASAVSDGEAAEIVTRKSRCRCIQFDVNTTSTLHEKDTFTDRTRELGLPVPETHNVTSREAVHRVLNRTKSRSGHRDNRKSYIMKSVGMDDASRGNIMTLLPRRTVSETYNHVSKIPISVAKPFILQQYILGQEYCTHALVIHNQVIAFVACPSSELLMHYEALPPMSALCQAMLAFTKEFCVRSGGDMTGHLSFDFLIEEKVKEDGVEARLQAIECNPRAHTAVLLFQTLDMEVTSAYLSALIKESEIFNGNANGHLKELPPADKEDAIIIPQQPQRYYWIGHDVVELFFHPLLSLLMRQISVYEFLKRVVVLWQHILMWKDGTFEMWDPLPWWWLYHVYWPAQFLACILQGRRWSRINVSTGKMFEC
ncbi:MAG: hypothetical protein Q9190_004826 [Brigantiaea leucoxantha]